MLVLAILASDDDALSRARALAVGAVLALVGVAATALLLFHLAGLPERGEGSGRAAGVIDLMAAIALAAIAARALKPLPTAQERQAERAEHAPGAAGRYVALGVGVAMLGLGAIVLVVTAAKDIARATDVTILGEVAATAGLTVTALLPAWLPVALFAAGPDRAAPQLHRLGRHIYDHQRAIAGGAAAAFAAYLLIRGVLVLR